MLKGLPQQASTFPVGHFTHSPRPYLYLLQLTHTTRTHSYYFIHYTPSLLNKARFIYLEERDNRPQSVVKPIQIHKRNSENLWINLKSDCNILNMAATEWATAWGASPLGIRCVIGQTCNVNARKNRYHDNFSHRLWHRCVMVYSIHLNPEIV